MLKNSKSLKLKNKSYYNLAWAPTWKMEMVEREVAQIILSRPTVPSICESHGLLCWTILPGMGCNGVLYYIGRIPKLIHPLCWVSISRYAPYWLLTIQCNSSWVPVSVLYWDCKPWSKGSNKASNPLSSYPLGVFELSWCILVKVDLFV